MTGFYAHPHAADFSRRWCALLHRSRAFPGSAGSILVAGIVVGVYPASERIASPRRLTAKEGQTYYRNEPGGSEGEPMRRHLHNSLLILMALACLLLIASACGSDSEQPSATDLDEQRREWYQGGNLLFTTNRTVLSICVDGAEGYTVTPDDLDGVRLALEDAIRRTAEPPTEYGVRVVVEGCPEPRAPSYVISTSGADRLDENDWNIGDVIIGDRGAPPEPSPHRLFVYLVPPDVYTGYFVAEPYFRHTAESLRSGDEFIGVTGAVYVRSSISHQDVRAALMHNLNLREEVSTDDFNPYSETATTVEGAIEIARARIAACPSYCVRDNIQSLTYVKTTVGAARDLFDPNRQIGGGRFISDAFPNSPVWIVVASGDFVMRNRGVIEVEPFSYGSIWVLVPQNAQSTFSSIKLETVDLSELGTVMQVPLPLPELPCSVRLEPFNERLDPACSVNEALSKISYRLETDQPRAVEIDSVVYVETTVGQAQRLFDPKGERGGGQFFEGAPDDLPVWAVVANGEFRASETMRGGQIFTYSSLWWVVAIGEKGFITGVNFRDSDVGFSNSDVGALGTVIPVPLPLPTFAAPVSEGD